MKKISLELQWAIGKKTGIGWYIYHIVKELKKSGKNEYIAEFVNFRNKYDAKKELACDIIIKENRLFPYRVYDFLTKKLRISHNLIFGTNSDIYHFFNFIIPKNIKGKVIITIYDTVFITAPETMGNKKTIAEYQYAAEKSDLIITISESAKNDIINNLHIKAEKIKIISPGIDLEEYSKKYSMEELKEVQDKYKLPKDYILYLGTIEPRKNIERIIRAFMKLKKEKNMETIKLVIAGGKGWKYEKVMELIEAMSGEIIFTDYIDEKDKIPIYKMAKMFVFPSLYEGFGIPVLEAMASGIPVITSNVSSLPEVAGDAAILVNPFNESEIYEGYKKLLLESDFYNDAVRRGLQQAKKFQWKESAKKLEEIYETMK